MVTRTVQCVGSAYSTDGDVNVQMIYNGVEVYNGAVETNVVDVLPVNQPDTSDNWQTVLFEFTTDTDITGEIPMSITVTNGKIFFGHLWMNYSGPKLAYNDTTETWDIAIPTQNYYTDPNTNTVESDGITNTTLNGSPWNWRVNVVGQIGDWAYPVADGETFTFDFFVDPAKVVLS